MKFVILILVSLLFSSCTHVKTPTVLAPPPGDSLQSEPMKQQIVFTTDDGVVIVGNWYPVQDARRAVLLLHMMPATKESWEALAKELNKRGIAALAIDLRGHGESIKKGVGSSEVGGREIQEIHFQSFTDQEHQESIRDVRAALTWLETQGFEKDSPRFGEAGQILLAGASIGANLALEEASENPEITRIVLLSPGLDYRGVETEPALVALSPVSKLLIIAAEGDEYAAESVKFLKTLRPTTTLTILAGSAHGTDLFDDHPEMLKSTADFLSQ